jgi:nucleotide-binding universal stress UspA family protein
VRAAISRHAAEVSIELARAAHAELTILYVSATDPPAGSSSQRRQLQTRRHEETVLREIVDIADHYDVRVRTRIAISDRPAIAILDEANRAGDTLIVLGVAARPSEALFFGDVADQLQESSRRSLLFVAS